jgi:mannose-6-phosphate isomerase-like protein (cupin superfamily)
VNPTFARVWHLTKSLGIGVGELLGEARSGAEKVRTYEHLKAHSVPVISSSDGLCKTRILSPIRQSLPVEWYEMILQPGGAIRANAHGNGAWEHQTVLSGQLVIEIGDSEVVLGPGDMVRYSAEQPHGARNDGTVEARVLLVVVSLQELGALGV